jgi:hypothetical protein
MTNIVPFSAGDMDGKRELAIADAVIQQGKNSGIRQKLYALQESVGHELEPVECPLQHVFAPGAYARTMRIPAGTTIVGKIHKHAHLNILSQGTVCVMTETEGDRELTGPLTMVSPPGTKRAVYAVTEAVWTTVHTLPRDNMTLDEIEAYVIAPTFEDYERFALENNMTNRIEVQA